MGSFSMHEVATISAKKMQATGHTTSRTAGSPLDVCQHPCPALCGMRCTSGPCMEHGPDEQVNCEASGRRLVLTSSESSLSPALDDSFLDVQIRRKQEVLRLRCLAHGETSEETVFAVAGLSNPALNPSGFFEHTCWKSPPAEFSLLTSDHRRIAAGTASNSTHAIAGDTYHATRRPSSRQFSFANSRVHGLISRLRSRAWSENSPAGVSSCFSPSRGVVKGATRSSRRSVFSQKNGGNTREKLAHLQEGARAAALKQLDASASGPVENGLVSGSSLDSSEIQKGQEKTGLKGGKPKRQLMHAPESKVNVYNWLFHSRFRNSFGAETAVLSPAPAFHVPETETRAVAEEIEESTDPSRFLKHSLDASSDSKETSGGYHGERVLRQNSERLPRARGTNSHRHNALRRSPCDLANGTEVSWSNPDASVESVQAGISNWHADFFTTGRENPLHSCREKDEDRTPVVASLPAPHHGGDTREREVSLPARRDLDGGESKGGSKGERELSGSHTELSSFPSVQGEASRCVRFPVSPSCHTKEIDGDGMLCTHSQTSTTGERKREPLGTADSAASCGFGDSETEDRKRFSSNTQQDPATHGGVRCCDKKLDPRSQARQQSTTSASQCVSGIGACLGSHPLTAAAHASRIKRVDTRGSTQQLVSDAPSPSAVPGLKPVEHTRTRMPAAAAAVQGGPTFLCRERNLGTRDRGSVLPSSRSQAESTDFGGELGCAGQSSGAKTQSASSSEGVVCQTAGGASSLGGMLRKRSSFETSEGVDSAAEPGNLGHLSRPRGAILSLAGGTECADNSRSGALGRSSLGRSFSSLSSSISFLLGARRPERRTGSLSRSQAVAPVLGDGATTNNREVVCADVHLPRCLTSPEEEEEVKHRLRHRSLGRALPPGAAGRPTAAGCSPCCPGPDRSNELHSLARGRSSPSATAAPLCAGSSVRTDTLGSYSSVSAAAASSSVSGPEFLLPDDPATTLGQTKSPDFTSFSPRLASFLSTRLKTILINYPPPQPRVLVLNEKDSVGIFLRALHEKRLSSCVVRHAKRRFGVKTVYSFADARVRRINSRRRPSVVSLPASSC